MALKFYNMNGELVNFDQTIDIIDTVLNSESNNLVTNAAITKELNKLGPGGVSSIRIGDGDSQTGDITITPEDIGCIQLDSAGTTPQNSNYDGRYYRFTGIWSYYIMKGYTPDNLSQLKYLRLCWGRATISAYTGARVLFPINMIQTPTVLTTGTGGVATGHLPNPLLPYNITPTYFDINNTNGSVVENSSGLNWIAMSLATS